MRKETLASIAERTGFSITTVSRVLNGYAGQYRICPETSDIIIKDALACHYISRVTTEYGGKNRFNVIGILVPSFSNQFFSDLSAAIMHEAMICGFSTISMEIGVNGEKLFDSIRVLRSRNIDGFIIIPCQGVVTSLDDVLCNLPAVFVDNRIAGMSLPFVCTNNYKGSLLAIRHLISCGHRRIVCIQGNQDSETNSERVRGYKDVMTECGFEENICVVGNDFTIDNGYNSFKAVIDSGYGPDAVFALSNTIIMGVLKGMRECSISCPKDISLVSYDSHLYMDYLSPRLTRVSQPMSDMGKLAVNLLVRSIEGESVGSEIKLSPSLIEGDSVSVM